MIHSDGNSLLCSIVIPTKNGGALFKSVIQKLATQKLWSQVELIVIDSGSTDDTVDIARASGARVFEISAEEFNHGATRDFGISLATSEHVILLVQDAVPYDNELINAMLAPFGDSEVAGVYARQLPQLNADSLTKRNLNCWLTGRTTAEVRKMKSLEWYESLEPIEKYFFCNFDNVCSSIRKSVWKEHKFGNISFGEDIDWAERILKSGKKIVYEPKAVVVHSHERSIAYEFKRTYVCHRKLFQLFGLQLVPNLWIAMRSWPNHIWQDAKYIESQEDELPKKLRVLIKIPILSLLSVLAQYYAAKDEMASKVRKINGV
ncbi:MULTISPECIES: glycosyltransferase [unclassified Methylomonas]|uniref:glycosyltransferase family 2 protein n=1 Tax=unclassified Methylomonas TaxID=2608980 RepID=UPI0008DAB9C6|nr:MULTISPECIES: glycosyltransferase [unclassified Methylomonas]NJA04845.1 glycosyltransferase [Methylococcaceae bacterium WWC4]OHX35254.1 hypothetical protein BJL95_01555 [Methylomonas sp. LWB]WGS87797.1 glycosyltransferase [Methylomonas sp. UP202]